MYGLNGSETRWARLLVLTGSAHVNFLRGRLVLLLWVLSRLAGMIWVGARSNKVGDRLPGAVFPVSRRRSPVR